MVALLTDVLLCVVLLGAGYFVFGAYQNSNGSTSSGSGKNKKKKQKAKSKKSGSGGSGSVAEDVTAVVEKAKQGIQSAVPKALSSEKLTKGGSPTSAGDFKAGAVEPLRPSTQQAVKPKKETNAQTQSKKGASSRISKEEFPPLSASTDAKSNGNSGPSSSSAPRPLAERLAKPARKTAVDDMLDRDIEPEKTFSRTMRIVKPGSSTPTLLDEEVQGEDGATDRTGKTEYDDFGNVVEKEDEWERVPSSSGKKSGSHTPSTFGGSSYTSSSSAIRSIPGMTEPTKKQRQNAARAAAQKAAKDAAEQERLRKLASHKRGLERERMEIQDKERQKLKGQQQQRTNKDTLSGGMTAKVVDGSLIWE